mgnify:CR=1 FL=1
MWMMGLSAKEKQLIESLREYAERFDVASNVLLLKKQITELEIEKGRMVEDHEKQKRELTHMIGLEKKRQEFEIDKAKSETSLKVREENLSADKKRFEEQMKFNNERFTSEVGYLKDMMGQILERVPNLTANLEVGRKR